MERDQFKESLDPLALFRVWLSEAEATEPNDPNAAALATASRSGAPSTRIVLMKQLDQRGFAFFTNAESRKGLELRDNPQAAMCFHWKSLRRQVRVEGLVEDLPEKETDAYFHSRSRLSHLGAAASSQSRPLESRDVLERRVQALEAQYPGEVPRPYYWKGYVLRPERIEFWADGAGRLHDRILFVRGESGWVKSRLFP
jgi:pyridoxamine 5'-phosphate oxidase